VRERSGPVRSEIRWTIVVVILAAAGVIALWPLLAASRVRSPSRVAPQFGVGAEVGTPEPDDTELGARRQQADLLPCPVASPVPAEPAGPLAGVQVPCLGSPGTVDLGAALAGRPALLNVWASWCVPCQEEIPVLAAYADEPGALPVIGINVQDHPSAALALLARLGARYPSVIDSTGAVRAALRAPPILPTSYVVRVDGSVHRVDPPVVFRTVAEVRRDVEKYLGDT